MSKNIINTEKAPAPIGPYSQAVEVNGMLFVSGQIPIIPETGAMEEGGIEDETKQVMENLKAILEAAGGNMSNIVKTSIFVADMNDFVAVNGVYGQYFESDPPARETIAVKTLPKNVNVEISCIAAL
ncbi:MAG: RidA family protein [Bacteroidota bacterium]